MNERKSNMKELEEKSRKEALNQVIKMFQRPGQLEKVDQFKRTFARKKASFEGLLKSAMQQQLDGVRVGLNELHSCLETVKEIDDSLKRMSTLFNDVPKLCSSLNEVREENMRHSQYVTAKENMKYIFTIPESVEKTRAFINDGKLLQSHQYLRDLENSRDELLFELHKLPNQSPHDTSMLKAYFSEVSELSTALENQIRINLLRTLNTVRKDPTVMVTVLRIIEREEKSDEEAIKQHRQTGFMPSGRPKKWKAMAFQKLEESVAERIEGTQIEGRDNDKLWLIRYLELLRKTILEDLRVVKTLCVPCFPPHYNIIDTYIHMYHNSLSQILQGIIVNGLEGNEYVTVLSWVLKTYKSKEMLGHPDLIKHTESLDDLLPDTVFERLETEYLTNIEKNYGEWLENTLKSEKDEWYTRNQSHLESYSRTSAPIIIFQMIDQNLQVAKTISDQMTYKMLAVSIEQVIRFGDSYRTAILELKKAYFDDRNKIPYFTNNIILITNDCLQLVDLGTQLEQQYLITSAPASLNELFDKLKKKFINLRNDAGDILLEELSKDLEQHFEKLLMQQWLNTSADVDTIYATLEDYFQDYSRLANENYNYVVKQTRQMVVKNYLQAMLSRRTKFKEELNKVANKIEGEAKKLQELFETVDNDPFEAIFMLAEVIRSDKDMISLELHKLIERYPDITEEHILRLFYVRGDISKEEAKDYRDIKPPNDYTNASSIFKTLLFPKLNLNIPFK